MKGVLTSRKVPVEARACPGGLWAERGIVAGLRNKVPIFAQKEGGTLRGQQQGPSREESLKASSSN